MNILHLLRSAIALAIGLSIVLSFGCAVSGDGYGYNDNVNVGIGIGYYEPFGSYYGGWAPGYRVGPSRGGNFTPNRGADRPTPHAYRPAHGSRPLPSIPARPRPRQRSGDPRPH